MCGINGIFGLNNPIRSKDLVGRMNATLAHRGPDADGVYADEHLALGHRRLAIIDPHPEGNQPFYSKDKRLVLVYNGEIYNYRELKIELSDYPFQTKSDTEVIIAAYLKWGKSCVEHFNGMFAFAIWDQQEKELFIARDRMGIKPIYFIHTNECFIFSSEIRSLVASGLFTPKLDESSLVDYLRYQTVHAPDTILQGVKMVLPGHTLTLHETEITVSEYWNASKNFKNWNSNTTYEETQQEVRRLLQASVKRRLIADVPFGAFLSGGIDSSAIVGLMSQVSDQTVSTFTITFEDEKFSEAKYARLIAEKFKTNHHEIKLHPDELLHVLPSALQAMDHPGGDGPNTWLVSRVTKDKGISMALTGLGGDELFAGYDVFKQMNNLKSREWLQYFPKLLRKAGAGIYSAVKPGTKADKLSDFLRLDYFDHEHVYPLSRQVMKESLIMEILNKNKLPQRSIFKIMKEAIGPGTRGAALPELSKISYGEMYSYMQNVLLRDSDQMGMAHALELRVPFLDYELVEYVMGVPNKFKYPHSPKKLLVDAMGDLLPSEVVNRPKMGFTFPWEYWMKNELKSFCESRMISLSKRKNFNEEKMIGLWKEFLKNNPRVSWSRIWYLVVLEDWLSTNGVGV